MFEDPKFWLTVSFILFVILMIKPFKSMMIGGLDQKIEEIKSNINSSLKSFSEAEVKLKEAEKQTEDLDNKIQELLNSAKSQAETISKNIVDKTSQTISSKEKNSLERIKQIEISAIQSIKKQASIELNSMITNYLANLSDSDRNKVLEKSVSDFKSIN
ncbi:MAG: ATP synthase subunit b [Pelagibacteraceae bacterium]|jgi:F-type H+-transporting ATPase subunit b|nr:MAG: ATP synthase subunit b [Pelagibacteraceae bacterium]|tara:strand:+ start:479 stop:955 length:477 start_codon:yes stop_codon:yes gene_type:complete